MSVPGAPTVGVITPGNLQLSVAFTAGTGTVTNYKYSTDNGATWTTRSPVATTSPLVITGLTNGTQYSVILRATNTNGDSVSSNMVQSTPRTTPGAPTIGTITFPSSGTISVPFTAPASDGGSAITNYAYSTTGAAGTFTNIAVAQTTSPISITGLTNGTAYQVSIRAINAAGNGTSATAVSATPYTTPSAPILGTITPGNQSLSVAFTAGATGGNALTNYEYSTDNGSSWTVRSPSSTATPISITGLTNGVSYTVKLRAVNAAGSGATQASGTAGIPRTVPDAPTGVTATPGATTVLSIAWTAPASNGGNAITAYRIERSLDGATAWTVLTSAQASSPYSSTALTNGTLYYYRVSATNAAGFGAVSSSASGTPRTVPGAPTIGSVTTTSSTAVSVPFTAPASNGGNAITSYVVTPYIGAAAQTTVSGASSPISVTGLTTGQAYTFKVHAVNAAGAGTQSAASAAVSLVYNSVSAPSGASYTYASAVALTDSKISYTGTASSDVVITPTGTAWTISAGGNTDTLNFVRKVVFTDKIIYLAGSGVDTATAGSTVGSYTMTTTIVGGANIIAAYIVNANTEYTANSKVAVIYLAGDTIYTSSVSAADLNIISPVSILGITMNAKKPLISRWNNHLLRFMMVRSSNVTVENVIFDLNITTGGTETNAGAVDMGFVNPNLTLLDNIVFKNVDMVRGYQRGVNMNYMNNVTFDGCTFPRVTTRASIGMVSCKNVTIKNCTIPRSGTTLTGYGSIYIGTSNGPRDIYAASATYNNNRSGWTDAQKMDAVKSANIDLSLNNTFTDDNSLPATIQLDPYKLENGNDSFQYSLTYTGTTPDVKLPAGFAYSFTNAAAVGSAIVKTNITRASTDISGTSAAWGFDPTNVTVRRLDTNARIYPVGYELPATTFDPTTITDETSIPVSIGGARTEVPIRDSTSLSGLSALSPVLIKGVTAAPKLAVFTSSDPGAAVKNSIDNNVNAVAVQRTVKGAAKTSLMDVKKRSAVTSVVATKTVGGQTQTATADITSLPSTHSVILSIDDIDGTAGLKANVYFKVIDGSGNVVTSGISLPIEFDVPGTDAITSLDLYVYNTTTSNYEKTGTLTKKAGTATTFSYTFTTNSDYQLVQHLSTPLFISVRNQSRPYYSLLTIDASMCSYTNAVAGGDPVTNALYDVSGTLNGSDTITVQFDISRNELLTPVTSQYSNLSGDSPYSNAIRIYDIFINGSSVLRTGVSTDYDISYNSGTMSVFPTAPSAPTPYIASHSGTNICFTWYTPDLSGGLPLTAYRIYYLASTPYLAAIARNDPDPFFDNATYVDLSSATLVANAFVLTNAAANDVYVFVTKAINAAGISSYTSLYNETAADYAENISRVASQASFLFDGEMTAEVASLIEQMVAASGINNYRGTESLRSGLGDNVTDSIYAFFEAATIAQVGGANLGQLQDVSGADAQAMYDHMVAARAANPASVQQSLIDKLQRDLSNNTPFPVTYARFVINPATRLQVAPYPVIQATGEAASIIPVPHGMEIKFDLAVGQSGKIRITRNADNMITAATAVTGIHQVSLASGQSFPIGVGARLEYKFISTGPTYSLIIPALAEVTFGELPVQLTGVKTGRTQSTSNNIVVYWTNPNNASITGYTISSSAGDEFTFSANGTSTTYGTITVADANNAALTFTVVATNANGDSVQSDPAAYDPGYVPCFPAGVRILTPIGYRAVETLRSGELVQTADGRSVAIKVYTTELKNVSAKNAPYLIPAHTFGYNSPPADLRLSGLHAFQVKKGLWKVPAYANNSKVVQYGVGESVTYYHIECPNYFRDNLVAEGCVVESYAGKQVKDTTNLFRYNRRLDAFTRTAENSKISHA